MSTFNITDETKKKKDQMDVSLANMDKAAADYNKMNYGSFVQGDDYKALSQRYQQNGQMAMKDTLGQMAARTGGMASSYANSAAQQSYNGYMEKLEDAARSLYDSQRQEKMDALSVASSIYDRDRAAYETGYANDYKLWEEDYDRGRDAKADADALKSEWTTTISNAAYNEKGLTWADYEENIPRDANGNPIISEAEFNALVNAAGQAYKSDTWQQNYTESENAKAIRDAELTQMLTAEGFDWANYDWDGDGKIGTEDNDGDGLAEFFEGSNYGTDYWKSVADDAQKTHKIAGYKYQNTAEGAAGIVTALTKGANFSLNEEDQENFDYIYGEGAYETTKNAIDTAQKQIRNINIPNKGERYEQGGFLNDVESAFYHLAEQAPWLNEEQIFMLLEKMNPKAMQIYANAEDYFGEPASVHGYDKNGRAIYAAG